MRLWTGAITVGAALVLSACGPSAEQERRIAELESEVAVSHEAAERAETETERLRGQNDRIEEELRDAQAELKTLRVRLRDAGDTPPADTSAPEAARELKDRIEELEAQVEGLKAERDEAVERAQAAENATAETAGDTEGEAEEGPDPAEVERRIDELMPMVKAGDTTSINDVYGLANGADKATRDAVIQDIRDWVAQEPDNKHARFALSMVLLTRFQDIENPMEQGALAAEARAEIEKAVELDPEYYDGQHLLAVFMVGYPPFTPEFKSADDELDKALEMQKQLAWEDRFAEVYAAYSRWHRTQEQLEEAAAWVQKGLDHAPRNDELLAEKAAVENAQNEQKE